MEAKEIAGTYNYTYPSVGGKSRFSIKRINSHQVVFNLVCEGKEPNPYKHTITDDTLEITDNKVLHLRNSNCNCEFPITFYNDFAIIKFNFDPEYCLWDNTRGMDGIYVKTSGEFTPVGQ